MPLQGEVHAGQGAVGAHHALLRPPLHCATLHLLPGAAAAPPALPGGHGLALVCVVKNAGVPGARVAGADERGCTLAASVEKL